MQVQEAAQNGAETAQQELSRLEQWIERVLPVYAEYPLLQVVTIVAFFVIASTFVSWFLKRVVSKLFDKTQTTLDDHILNTLTTPVYVTVIASGLRLALTRIDMTERASNVASNSVQSVVIVVWLVAALRICGLVLKALSQRQDRFDIIRPTTLPLFDNLSKILLVVIAVYMMITAWDGNLSGLLAAGGIAGLAIGLASRDTLANLFAGIFIFADSPYKIGDFINLDSGERGQVTNIGLRSTRLLTRDDVEITIPNGVMGAAKIINESGGPHVKYRIRIKVGVAYGSDIDQVRDTLMDVANNQPMVCPDPEPRVRFRVFGASSLDLELLCWIEEPVLRGRAIDSLNTEVYKRFNQDGIEIPYSKHDIYVREMPGASLE